MRDFGEEGGQEGWGRGEMLPACKGGGGERCCLLARYQLCAMTPALNSACSSWNEHSVPPHCMAAGKGDVGWQGVRGGEEGTGGEGRGKRRSGDEHSAPPHCMARGKGDVGSGG